MITTRQATRQKINSLIDEMIVDLKTIKHHTLSMDEFIILTIGKGLAHRFNKILIIYRAMDNKILPPDRRSKKPEELKLG